MSRGLDTLEGMQRIMLLLLDYGAPSTIAAGGGISHSGGAAVVSDRRFGYGALWSVGVLGIVVARKCWT